MLETVTSRPVTPSCAVPVFYSDELMFSPLKLENSCPMLSQAVPSHCGTAVAYPPGGLGFSAHTGRYRLNRRCSSVSHGTASATVGTTSTAAAVREAAPASISLLPRPD